MYKDRKQEESEARYSFGTKTKETRKPKSTIRDIQSSKTNKSRINVENDKT